MTKQEKILIKNSLLPLQSVLFTEQWSDLVSDHPYVEQDDDDIEDDVVLTSQRTGSSIEAGRAKLKQRAADMDTERVSEYFGNISEAWGGQIFEKLNGCAIGYEHGLGVYMRTERVYISGDSSITRIVPTNDPDEAAYLMNLGYRKMSDLLYKNN